MLLRTELVDLTRWLNADLYERERSDAKAVQASLEDLHGKLASALEALRILGHDALEALHRQAKNEIVRDRRENDGAIWKRLDADPVKPSGEERYHWLERALDDATRWAVLAEKVIDVPRVIVDPPDPDDPNSKPRCRVPGRPTDTIAGSAMDRLVEIWEEQTGAIPTLITDSLSGQKRGDFLDFGEAVFRPVYTARGLKTPSIQSLAQKSIKALKSSRAEARRASQDG